VGKSVRCSCQIFSGINEPKIIKMGYLLTELSKKLKINVFFGTQCIGSRIGSRIYRVGQHSKLLYCDRYFKD